MNEQQKLHEREHDHEEVYGQADDLDRGTGRGASGGGLGETTGFWSDKPLKDDLKKAGVDPDFNRSLDEGRGKN